MFINSYALTNLDHALGHHGSPRTLVSLPLPLRSERRLTPYAAGFTSAGFILVRSQSKSCRSRSIDGNVYSEQPEFMAYFDSGERRFRCLKRRKHAHSASPRLHCLSFVPVSRVHPGASASHRASFAAFSLASVVLMYTLGVWSLFRATTGPMVRHGVISNVP